MFRFSTEEKAKRSPIMWLPFGYGPRNCIGMRLATYGLKVAVVHILRYHRLTVCEKTEVVYFLFLRYKIYYA